MAVPPAKEDEKRIEEAQKLAKTDPAKAEAIYKETLTREPGATDVALRNFEKALVGLGELFRDQKRANDLADLIRQTRSALSSFAKSKTAKLGTASPCASCNMEFV
jgi:26S proteasome regulatory subunit N6